jgi:hypothetical protein
MKGPFAILGVIALTVFLLALGPWLVIWALNTLFPALSIPFNFWTWASVMILYGSFHGKTVYVKK